MVTRAWILLVVIPVAAAGFTVTGAGAVAVGALASCAAAVACCLVHSSYCSTAPPLVSTRVDARVGVFCRWSEVGWLFPARLGVCP